MSYKSGPKSLNLKEYQRPKRTELGDARIPPLSPEQIAVRRTQQPIDNKFNISTSARTSLSEQSSIQKTRTIEDAVACSYMGPETGSLRRGLNSSIAFGDPIKLSASILIRTVSVAHAPHFPPEFELVVPGPCALSAQLCIAVCFSASGEALRVDWEVEARGCWRQGPEMLLGCRGREGRGRQSKRLGASRGEHQLVVAVVHRSAPNYPLEEHFPIGFRAPSPEYEDASSLMPEICPPIPVSARAQPLFENISPSPDTLLPVYPIPTTAHYEEDRGVSYGAGHSHCSPPSLGVSPDVGFLGLRMHHSATPETRAYRGGRRIAKPKEGGGSAEDESRLAASIGGGERCTRGGSELVMRGGGGGRRTPRQLGDLDAGTLGSSGSRGVVAGPHRKVLLPSQVPSKDTRTN
ncbi:hypothetical protein R3P38DRAFT_2770701 [Favolaschia claudopus]|uniref:Uncharacterized protein n=1 Tax=Favolaschia claudopus TaxID=2862362 RepID=A0AAW0CHP4_9AGAR